MSDGVLANDPRVTTTAAGSTGPAERGSRIARVVITVPIRVLAVGLRGLIGLVLAPFRLLQMIRHSMTAASVSVMLTGIMTLNIIWGYPWTGMFAACISLLCIGMAVNFWMRPRLRIDFVLPAYIPAGQPCNMIGHGVNVGLFPAFDFSVKLLPERKTQRRIHIAREAITTVQTPPTRFGMAAPGQQIDFPATVVFTRRGIQTVPDVEVTTTFPFHLFRNRHRIETTTKIAVTPKPLTGEEDPPARALLQALGGFSHRLLAGDALDYTGSREYQPGMPVRRWDFSSWARLGRPIVREFQSPSLTSVLLVIDTAVSEEHAADEGAELMERALSLAATAIIDLSSKSIRVQMYLTSEQVPEEHSSAGDSAMHDCESMQIRLAEAEPVTSLVADDRIRQTVLARSAGPTLLITSRRGSEAASDVQGHAEILCVDQASSSDRPVRPGDKAARLDPAHRPDHSARRPRFAVTGGRS